MSKNNEPVVGVPFYVDANSYQSGALPPNAIVGDPMGAPIQQTIYRDTPAPFNCVYCGNSGVTKVRVNKKQYLLLGMGLLHILLSKPSLAAVVGCMMPFMLGFCFLCPSMDCLWHKYHYCPVCKENVANFEKSDPCAVMDPPHWKQLSFALPA